MRKPRPAAGAGRDQQAAPPLRPIARLGALPVKAFLARHWQRRPLLVRQAVPAAQLPFTPEALFELAGRDDAESRLIERTRGRWRLRHGPFARTRIPPTSRGGWTLLVQGVDLQLEAAARLIARFRFLPDARLDDLMVSYASDGGGVGAHVDSYDVFLLQAFGRRRWRIQRDPDPACVPGLPIRQLARFRPHSEWVLEPGDLLYLPPGVAHEGVALGPCITCSIGFRTPSWADLAVIWSELQADRQAGARAPFRDPGLPPTRHPARLPPRMIEQARHQLLHRQPDRHGIELALLRQLSEPKPRVIFEPPARPLTPARFADAMRHHGLATDRRTRMLYSNRALAINGELIALPDPAQRNLFKTLADRRVLLVQQPAQRGLALSSPFLKNVYDWYLAGWVHPRV